MNFGDFLRQQRLSLGLSLRVFCSKYKEDPVQWSRLERSMIFPPKDIGRLISIAKKLQVEDKKFFIDLAKTAKLAPEPVLKDIFPCPFDIGGIERAKDLLRLIQEENTPREEYFS